MPEINLVIRVALATIAWSSVHRLWTKKSKAMSVLLTPLLSRGVDGLWIRGSGDSLAEYGFGTTVDVNGNRIAADPAPKQMYRRVHIFDRVLGSLEVGNDGDCPYSISPSNVGGALAIGDP